MFGLTALEKASVKQTYSNVFFVLIPRLDDVSWWSREPDGEKGRSMAHEGMEERRTQVSCVTKTQKSFIVSIQELLSRLVCRQ